MKKNYIKDLGSEPGRYGTIRNSFVSFVIGSTLFNYKTFKIILRWEQIPGDNKVVKGLWAYEKRLISYRLLFKPWIDYKWSVLPHHLSLIKVYLEKSDDLTEKKKSAKQNVTIVMSSFLHLLRACYLSGTVLGSGITRTKEVAPRGLWSTWEPL